jgi:hypothetical protein
MSGSSIVSTRTPQITPVMCPALGFSRAPAKKSARVVLAAICRSSSESLYPVSQRITASSSSFVRHFLSTFDT